MTNNKQIDINSNDEGVLVPKSSESNFELGMSRMALNDCSSGSRTVDCPCQVKKKTSESLAGRLGRIFRHSSGMTKLSFLSPMEDDESMTPYYKIWLVPKPASSSPFPCSLQSPLQTLSDRSMEKG